MLEAITIGIALLYVLEYSLFRVGLGRGIRRWSRRSSGRPFVSVVVAARNEEKNIAACLVSLSSQSYPADRYEIIAVDDESDDLTGAIIDRHAATSDVSVRHVRTRPENGNIRGKARAVAQGIDASRGQIILMTDADCTVPTRWVEESAARMRPDIDVVAGFTVVQDRSLFSLMQQLDWLHLQTLAAASMSLGSPVGVVGNNMGFRRSAYDRVGGYRGIEFSVTEDFALFLALVRSGSRVAYAPDVATKVSTRPCATLRDVLRQKHRWGRGGTDSTLHGYSILLIAFLMLCALCAAPFVSVTAWISVWSAKMAADLLLMFPVVRRLRLFRSMRGFLPFQFYFIAQALVVPLLLLNSDVRWKGRVISTSDRKAVRQGG